MARRKKNSFTNPLLFLLLGIAAVGAVGTYPGIALAVVAIVIVIAALYFGLRWYKKSAMNKKILMSGIREIDVMQGVEFEKYLQVLFENMGYRVKLTPQSGDFGADLVLEKDGRTIVVQVKRYNKTVGVEAIQEVYSSKAVYHAAEAWVVTNQDFSQAAQQLAQKNRVTLINRTQLIDLIRTVQSRQRQNQPVSTSG